MGSQMTCCTVILAHTARSQFSELVPTCIVCVRRYPCVALPPVKFTR